MEVDRVLPRGVPITSPIRVPTSPGYDPSRVAAQGSLGESASLTPPGLKPYPEVIPVPECGAPSSPSSSGLSMAVWDARCDRVTLEPRTVVPSFESIHSFFPSLQVLLVDRERGASKGRPAKGSSLCVRVCLCVYMYVDWSLAVVPWSRSTGGPFSGKRSRAL